MRYSRRIINYCCFFFCRKKKYLSHFRIHSGVSHRDGEVVQGTGVVPGVRKVVKFVHKLLRFIVEVVVLIARVVSVVDSSKVGGPFNCDIATIGQSGIDCVNVAEME
jgi:hypothetical protein